MFLFRLARKNIQNFAVQRLKQFIWVAMSTVVCFFITSVQLNEVVIGKLQHMWLLVEFINYGSIILILICVVVTYKITDSLLQKRKKEFEWYEVTNLHKKQMICLLCQEQLLIYGGALLFGLIHGMLFLKLFTIIVMKAVGIQGVNSAPITTYAITISVFMMITVIGLSMWQCCRFIQGIKGESSYKTKKKA
ncbi:ABC transporter permease [Bacillus clarus]|uniref:ABC transporter permease n=1 Tax=Bacillus clarus TaxID=2338372 RepID=A0A090YXC2_9BACI|nr:FtsX-like permease family protein [Bacillus clarus]KFN03584.1 ftsX-like permease family protein [Bacillus clarus]RFT64056.1 ABC transporter permease [Bacillus clarus]